MTDEQTDSAPTAESLSAPATEPPAVPVADSPAVPVTDSPAVPVADSSSVPTAGLGKSIVESFKNSIDRLKSEPGATPAPDVPKPTPAVEQTAPMAVPVVPLATPATPVSHLGSGMTVSVPIAPAAPEKKKAAPRAKTAHQTRRARLRISRVDPWSVMKTALLFGVAGWIIFIVATWIIFTVLSMTGLYDAINSTVAQIFTAPGANPFNIEDYVNTTRATALAALIGAVNVVIVTALATIFAFLYNLSAAVMGGIEVTMAED